MEGGSTQLERLVDHEATSPSSCSGHANDRRIRNPPGRRTAAQPPTTTAARPHRVRLDGSGIALRTIRRSELVATTCPLNRTLSTSVPELCRTVPADGGRPSKVEVNENGTAGSVNSVIPAAGPVRNSSPKLAPPNEKSPDWKLDG